MAYFARHPFSISSAPSASNIDGSFTIHVHCTGKWTSTLWDLAAKKSEVDVRFEGPYGEPSFNIEGPEYSVFLLISGGSGITKLRSMCNQLLDESSRGRPIDLIWFAWSSRDVDIIKYWAQPSNLHPHFDPNPRSESDDFGDRPSLPSRKSFDSSNSSGGTGSAESAESAGSAEDSNKPKRRLSAGSTHPLTFPSKMDDPKALSWSRSMKVSPDSSVQLMRDVFFVNGGLLNTGNVHTQFYKTGPQEDAEDISPVSVPDFFRSGRIDFENILKTLKQAALKAGETRVAVCVCGPEGLQQKSLQACINHSDSEIVFDCYEERFSF